MKVVMNLEVYHKNKQLPRSRYIYIYIYFFFISVLYSSAVITERDSDV